VFFFDEAHLLFNDAPKVLLERIELVVRLVRSKGVGVYFVTQNPLDIPDSVLGQLGNRVQHALRAFTPRDQKAVKAAAATMRPNPGWTLPRPSPSWPWARRWSASSTKRPPQRHRARVRDSAGQPDRPHHGRAAQGADAALAGGRRLRAGRGPRIGLRGAAGRAPRQPRRPPRAAAQADEAGAVRSTAAARPAAAHRPPTRPTTGGGKLDGLAACWAAAPCRRGGRKEGLAEAAARSAMRSIGSAVGRGHSRSAGQHAGRRQRR
jgi:hypothetical protein